MLTKDNIEAKVHYAASFIGGYFGIYALMVRSDNFGSSQTSNLIYIVSLILGNTFADALIRIGAVFIYMSAIALTVLIKKYTKLNVKLVSMVVSFLAITILSFLPKDMNPILGLYPIFFAMAFQWNSFNGAYGFVSSTIFSTNNLRQLTMSSVEVLSGNKSNINKFKFFGTTLILYHLGVAVSFMLNHIFSIQSIWFCTVPIVVESLLILKEISLKNESNVIVDKNISIYTGRTA